ncbi:bifunctional 2-polyprenyl-6-hydroxyphenol methylase/3-demethylubiquinol 3-O-methyltransferase UbiG [Sulfurivirga sp.]|uniref:bifunctional 2-polyprenyl-6-hydroxyphenol methylase/3-demethylubiquinol 3-O-methyltransferase UbiG n=1 Tax=Sulfurivirga sp. TaxID=2614236 RepID=UPI0025FD2D7D|nr:bifunctional 2-polyprenyl-6-hydroxyphenol methylase/3-demethylubiquinol 3-O-methyltransferase UbiG [Sulfurivirga sp.]
MSNANPDALQHFDAQAHQWWDENGPMATLHQITPARVEFVERNMPLEGMRLCDIGCGGGLVSEALARKGAQVTGIDLAEEALTVARLHALESGLTIDYRPISAEALAEEMAGQFDGVTCLDMLEHVPEPAEVVRAAAHLLKPGGVAVFSTLNRTLKARLLAVELAEKVLGLLPRGTHDPEHFIRPHELEHWARASGLRLKDESGLCYSPLSHSARLCDDLSINYLMAFEKT